MEKFINYIIPFTIFLVLVINGIRTYANRSLLAAWFTNFMGTFLHELMHLIVSIIFFGKPFKISLFPKREGDYIVLGYVKSANIRWYNAFPIAMAPLLLFVIAFYFDKYYFQIVDMKTIWQYILYIFVMISLIQSAIPSAQDFKVAFSNFGSLIYIVLFVLIIYFYFNGSKFSLL